jgi:hypothetical protein
VQEGRICCQREGSSITTIIVVNALRDEQTSFVFLFLIAVKIIFVGFCTVRHILTAFSKQNKTTHNIFGFYCQIGFWLKTEQENKKLN